MRRSYRPIAKRPLTAPTTPDPHLTLSQEKRSMKWSKSAVTDVMDKLERSNTLSNGKDIPKATTRGNQLTRCTPRNS